MISVAWPLASLLHLANIVFPWRADPHQLLSARVARAALHVLFWTAVLSGLWLLNRQAGVERFLRSPWPGWHGLWLPTLAGVVYLFGWLSCGLWLALHEAQAPSPWPDLDAAWLDARQVLARKKINAADAPLYLVLGSLTPELQALFDAVEASRVTPDDAPFQVCARRGAVLVICGKVAQLSFCADADGARWPSTLSALAQRDEVAGRLHHLCALLAHTRSKGAVNGIVLMTPVKADAGDPSDLVRRCRNDLAIVRTATGLDVPLYFVVSGLSELPDSGPRAWFQRFPPLPDLDPAEIVVMFQDGIARLCSTQIPQQLRERLQLDTSAHEPGALMTILRTNIEHYQRWHTIQTLQPRLVELLVEGAKNEYAEAGMVAGCYLLPSPESAHALWTDLAAYRNMASLTPAVARGQAEMRRRVRLGYAVGFAAAMLALTGMGLLLWWRM